MRSNTDCGKSNKEGWTALHYASAKGHLQIVKLLLRHKNTDQTAILLACHFGHAEVVQALLEDPRVRATTGYDDENDYGEIPEAGPTIHAAHGGFLNIIEILIASGKPLGDIAGAIQNKNSVFSE